MADMKTLEVIGKAAKFFAYISAAFVALSVILSYLLIQSVGTGAPADYVAIYIFTGALPYMFLLALSAVVAYVCGQATAPEYEEEAPMETESADADKKAEEEFS